MASTLPRGAADTRLQRSEIRPRMAKVDGIAHRKAEIHTFRVEMGRCIERARYLSQRTLKEFADAIGRDASQVGKWIDNTEPPQVDTVLMSRMRPFMVQALAESTDECEVTTEIRLRRRA